MPRDAQKVKVLFMTRLSGLRPSSIFIFTVLLAIAPDICMGEAPGPAVAAFDRYLAEVDARMARQHQSAGEFLAPAGGPDVERRLRNADLIVERLAPTSALDLKGAMLYHWRGTAFAAGATAADFERLMRDYAAYPQRFAPEVTQTRVVSQKGDRYQIVMRVRQHHVITVVMDTSYDVTFGRLDPRHGYSISRSTQVSEIDSPGTSHERVLSAKDEHGFLWRLTTYWSYEERDGGVYMQIESISLTRSIPAGLGWAVGPFVESVPRESLEFTLRSVCNALRK